MPTIRGADTGSKKRYAGLIRRAISSGWCLKGWKPCAPTDAAGPAVSAGALPAYLPQRAYQEYVRETIDKLMAGELDARWFTVNAFAVR